MIYSTWNFILHKHKRSFFSRKSFMFVDNERFLLELENRRYCEENIGQYKEEDISCKVFTYYFYYVFCYPRFMDALLSNLHLVSSLCHFYLTYLYEKKLLYFHRKMAFMMIIIFTTQYPLPTFV